MNLSAESIFSRNDNMVFRKIGDEYMLVPIRNKTGDLSNIYILNEIGARIWELLDGNHTVLEINGIIASEYEAAAEKLSEDLKKFLSDLQEIGSIFAE